jgi:hypothetical protein
MKLRRLLFVIPLSLMLAACLEPTAPRFPDHGEDDKEEPNQNELVVTLPH